MGAQAAVMGGAAAVNTGIGIFQSINGAKRAAAAKLALERYQRQELSNPYANIQVSTLGSDLQREELARNNATAINALQSGGARAMLAGLPSIVQNNTNAGRQIGATLDQQMANNQQLEAQGAFNQMQMQENREQQDLAGIGAELNAGIQQKWNGLNNIGGAIMGTATGLIGTGQLNSTPKVMHPLTEAAAPIGDWLTGAGANVGNYNPAFDVNQFLPRFQEPTLSSYNPLVGYPQANQYQTLSGFGSSGYHFTPPPLRYLPN
jgi:hypothetical protein